MKVKGRNLAVTRKAISWLSGKDVRKWLVTNLSLEKEKKKRFDERWKCLCFPLVRYLELFFVWLEKYTVVEKKINL